MIFFPKIAKAIGRGKRVYGHETDIMAVFGIFGFGITETDKKLHDAPPSWERGRRLLFAAFAFAAAFGFFTVLGCRITFFTGVFTGFFAFQRRRSRDGGDGEVAV